MSGCQNKMNPVTLTCLYLPYNIAFQRLSISMKTTHIAIPLFDIHLRCKIIQIPIMVPEWDSSDMEKLIEEVLLEKN